jgi:hypothetical protein
MTEPTSAPTTPFVPNRYGAMRTEVYDLDKPPGSLPDASCARHCAGRGLSPALRQARFQDFTYDRDFAAILKSAAL